MEPAPKSPQRDAARDPLGKLFGGEPTPARLRSTVGRQLFEYVLEESPSSASHGRLLVVDHDKLSRDILVRNLRREGYTAEIEDDPETALKRLGEGTFDLVLWEVTLPGLDGVSLLARVKKDEQLQSIPVVLLAEQTETATVIRCIEAGAEDYLAKPFNPALLKARLRGCLERKRLRDRERELLATVQAQQDRLQKELAEAAAYLRSLLPAPIQAPFAVDWRFIPSSELGGDAFGYHWIDDDHFAFYLLDVCGHGVGAALLSVTVLNVIRSGAMQGLDFRDPAAVLAAINRAFPMEQQGDRYFTLWYGVYQMSSRRLDYAAGGHPPVLLFEPGQTVPQKLEARGMMIGAMPNSRYAAKSCPVAPGSRLLLFCDGAYEITQPDGKVCTLDDFAQSLARLLAGAPIDLDQVVAQVRELRGAAPLEDDLSLVALQF